MQNPVTKVLFSVGIGKLKAPFTYLSSPRFKQYAEYHGFEYCEITEYTAVTHRDPKWIKIHYILQLLDELNSGDLISFLDADIAVVRGDIELTTNKSIAFAVDSGGTVNTGVLVVRVTQFSKQFFEAVWNRTDCEEHIWQDNLAAIKVLHELGQDELDQYIEILPNCLNTTLVKGEYLPYDQYLINPCLEPIRFRHFAGGQPWFEEYFSQPIVFDCVSESHLGTPQTLVMDALDETTLQPLNLKANNYIIFPNWQAPEKAVYSELAEVIKHFATHPPDIKTALWIDTSGISDEDAGLILSDVVMKLLVESDLEVSEELEISLIGKLEAIQWQALLRRIPVRIVLKHENQQALAQLRGQLASFYPILWTGTDDSLAYS
ncbi:hypothetical protein [Allocoleopsis franciscana]|uniref:Uncharacterized protein n=1 Tax=Allocoleopsis franciscana PCC 7113 TaxID=1173027 RepID=K9WLL4_9CYAN|nr:hypothetical protein [Allocoleopsis franciscana]AFZ20696.1 hypothetical protein Mic7113_5038 [Allocoleopsis franciscana PCC 7113]